MKILKTGVTIISIFAITTLFLAGFSYADIPRIINYQGKLTDPEGKPVSDGAYSVTFRIYDQEAGGSPLLWYETQSLTTKKGIFSTQIGATKDLNLPFDKPYYLGIQIGSDAEMTPRQPLTSAAYAFEAAHAAECSHTLTANSVDGIHASTVPTPNKLIALDSNGKLPISVLTTLGKAAEYTPQEDIYNTPNGRDCNSAGSAEFAVSADNTKALFIIICQLRSNEAVGSSSDYRLMVGNNQVEGFSQTGTEWAWQQRMKILTLNKGTYTVKWQGRVGLHHEQDHAYSRYKGWTAIILPSS